MYLATCCRRSYMTGLMVVLFGCGVDCDIEAQNAKRWLQQLAVAKWPHTVGWALTTSDDGNPRQSRPRCGSPRCSGFCFCGEPTQRPKSQVRESRCLHLDQLRRGLGDCAPLCASYWLSRTKRDRAHRLFRERDRPRSDCHRQPRGKYDADGHYAHGVAVQRRPTPQHWVSATPQRRRRADASFDLPARDVCLR